MRHISIRHHDVMPLALTACGVLGGPALLSTPGSTPDLPLAIAAIVLTAMIVGVTLLHRPVLVDVSMPAGRRRPRAAAWASP